MADLLDDTWNDRDLPVLKAAAQLMDDVAGGSGIDSRQIAQNTGLSHEDVIRGLMALDSEYISAKAIAGFGGGLPSLVFVEAVYGHARREVGLWPTPESGAQRLLQALEEQIESAPDEAERTRWQKLRDAILSGGGQVAVQVASAVITGHVPH